VQKGTFFLGKYLLNEDWMQCNILEDGLTFPKSK